MTTTRTPRPRRFFTRQRTGIAAAILAAAIAAPLIISTAADARTPTVHLPGAIGQTWQRNQSIGQPTNMETCTAGGSRCSQSFTGGEITWTPWNGAQLLRNGDILTTYRKMGGASGGMGAASTSKQTGLIESGQWQGFEQGGIFYHPKLGTFPVRAGMWGTWSRVNREWGILGFPTSREFLDARGTAQQNFQRGTILWTGGGIPVWQAINGAWQGTGAQNGYLGYPTAWETGTLRGDGSWQRFQGGEIWWSGATGSQILRAGFRDYFLARSAERGFLGFPATNESAVKGGSTQRFQGGRLYWVASTDSIVAMTPGDIVNRWDALGGPNSSLGLPIGEKTSFGGGGFYQRFERGVITWAPHTGPKVIDTATFNIWVTRSSSFGWPTKDGWTDARGAHVQFELAETIERGGRLYSAENIGASTAVIICDSQCDGDSWGEQGARANGYTSIVERSYGGGGYAAVAGALGSSVTDALISNRILLPQGAPGLVMLTLGGNDATQGRSDQEVLTNMRKLIDQVRATYPNARIVINGVMSRVDADHDRRRQVDALVIAEAARQGIPYVSVAGWGSTTAGAAYLDGVHLSQAGHNAVAPRYADALRTALGGQR